jgi:hypothetical protein
MKPTILNPKPFFPGLVAPNLEWGSDVLSRKYFLIIKVFLLNVNIDKQYLFQMLTVKYFFGKIALF